MNEMDVIKLMDALQGISHIGAGIVIMLLLNIFLLAIIAARS